MSTPHDARIAILGSSTNPARYSYKAVNALLRKGYKNLVGLGPKLQAPEGVAVAGSLKELTGVEFDTLTMYVGPETSERLAEEILAANPRRIIFNPGSENPSLEEAARERGIEVVEGCTLVMLATGEF